MKNKQWTAAAGWKGSPQHHWVKQVSVSQMAIFKSISKMVENQSYIYFQNLFPWRQIMSKSISQKQLWGFYHQENSKISRGAIGPELVLWIFENCNEIVLSPCKTSILGFKWILTECWCNVTIALNMKTCKK